jgi:hypothetical protein
MSGEEKLYAKYFTPPLFLKGTVWPDWNRLKVIHGIKYQWIGLDVRSVVCFKILNVASAFLIEV